MSGVGVWVGIAAFAFCTCFGIVAFLAVFMGWALPDIRAHREYSGANCTVDAYVTPSGELHCRGESTTNCPVSHRTYVYAAQLEVTVYDDEIWSGIAERNPNYRFSTLQLASSWQREYTIGETYPCRYRDGDRTNVIMSAGRVGRSAIAAVVVSVILCVFGVVAGAVLGTVLAVTVESA